MQKTGNKVTIVFLRKTKVMCSWSTIQSLKYRPKDNYGIVYHHDKLHIILVYRLRLWREAKHCCL